MIYVFLVDPEITQGPVDAARMLGNDVTFTCTATGLPIPDITWSNTSGIDIPVQAGDDMIINDTRRSQITVSDLQLGNFGTYTCTATNQFDSVSDSALLECKCISLSAANRHSYALVLYHTVFVSV